MTRKDTESAEVGHVDGPARRDASDEEVAIRAHEIFMNRGGEHGRDLDDWMQARKELSPERRSDDEY
jgi:hypothetical protein